MTDLENILFGISIISTVGCIFFMVKWLSEKSVVAILSKRLKDKIKP